MSLLDRDRYAALHRRYGLWPMAGAEDPPRDPPADPPKDDEDDDLDDDEQRLDAKVQEILRKNRAAEKAARKQAREAQVALDAANAKLRAHDDAQLNDQQRLEKERDDALAEAQHAKAESARLSLERTVERFARTLEFADTEDALAHFALHPGEIERDSHGAPIHLDQAVEKSLKALLERKPHLRAGAAGKGGGVTPSPRPHDQQSREQVLEGNKQKLAASGAYPRF